MRRKLCWIVILVIFFAGIPESANAQENPPTFEKTACKFDIPQGAKVDCGYVTVPENRNQSNNGISRTAFQTNIRTIRIFTAVFHAKNAHPELAPVIFLDGGPGVHSLDWTTKTRPLKYLLQLTIDHDLIMFDQRGTGYTQPNLDCPEIAKVDYDNLDKNTQSRAFSDLVDNARLACRDRLVKQGINLAAYSTAASAADANDIRQALGYEKVNLYGVSYGTRLAQSVMLQFPQTVRSVVLDSTLVGLQGFTNFNRNAPFTVLFNGCAKSEACNASYPNLASVFNDVVRELNQHPAMVSLTHPFTHHQYEILVTGDDLETGLFWALYSTTRIPTLPKLIFDARDGDYRGLAYFAFENNVVLGDEYISIGMNLSINCIDQFSRGLCREWLGNDPAPTGPRTVSSTLPALVLGGEYDPITPPRYSQTVTRTLQNSVFLEVPGTGHEAAFSGQCPMDIVLAFYKAPDQQPDATCISKLHGPDFVVRQLVSF